MFRQIEKLQKLVNNLLRLCTDGGADDISDDQPLSPKDKKYERLGVMLLKMQDGELEHRYMLRMEKWLLCDPNALRYYVDFQHLTATLHLHFNPDRFHAHLPGEVRVTSAG